MAAERHHRQRRANGNLGNGLAGHPRKARSARMITVFGSIHLDRIGSVERLPKPGETVPGSDFRMAPGGKGANQALAAARAGAPVRMVGAVGDDGFAAPALALLREGGVDLAKIRSTGGP